MFALISDTIQPKTFAGLFSAAPSIAMAGLVISALASGHAQAAASANGMIAGAIGMVGYCIAASFLVERFGARLGSAVSWLVWLACAAAAYWLLFR